MNEQTNQTIPTEQIQTVAPGTMSWLAEEQQVLEQNKMGTIQPALKLEDGKITLFEVNFQEPFEKWVDPQNGTIKKLIPVIHNGEHKIFWLNVRNPLYKQIVDAGTQGVNLFKVMRNGVANQTRYSIVKE